MDYGVDEPCPDLGIGTAVTSGWRKITVACGMGQVQLCQPKTHNNVKEYKYRNSGSVVS